MQGSAKALHLRTQLQERTVAADTPGKVEAALELELREVPTPCLIGRAKISGFPTQSSFLIRPKKGTQS